VSLRLYPHDLEPVALLDEMAHQATLAARVGFDGIMVSERHGGVVGNVPNPLQVTGFLAAGMSGDAWVAPCPVLALLRPPALIVEEVAWLAARYPGRVGVGLGTGGHELAFRMYGLPYGDLAARFEPVLAFVVSHLAGTADDEVMLDAAVARCRHAPVPVLSAAMSPTAARRAARCGAGTIGSSLTTLDRERRLSEAYRDAGGAGPEVLIRHVWLGDPPRDAINAKLNEYRRTAEARGAGSSPSSSSGTPAAFGTDEIIASHDPAEIAGRVAAALAFTGKTCVHLRVHVPGVAPEPIREQVELLGERVVPLLRHLLDDAGT
jgi:alkanesulfonate monooxygenase SsuD/methylene tetrahydromethanopterin reductase-like flavin-dependent oxidoreductase (luciferase family)